MREEGAASMRAGVREVAALNGGKLLEPDGLCAAAVRSRAMLEPQPRAGLTKNSMRSDRLCHVAA
eukprot:6185983-Pleurochrysis_carterae.AAC.1